MARKEDSIFFWLETAGRLPLLPKDEVLRLGHIIQDPNQSDRNRKRAADKLVKHNMRMIPLVVRRCLSAKRSYKFGDHFTEDLLQCGVLGLYRAAYKFDPKLGYAFSTYANAWIYQAVQREIYNNLSLIRVPETTIREIYNFVDGNKGFDFSDVKEDTRFRYMDACRALSAKSLDSTIANTELSQSDVVCSPESPEPLRDTFEELLDKAQLSHTQYDALKMVYAEGMSLSTAAKELSLTRHHMNKIINSAHMALKPFVTR